LKYLLDTHVFLWICAEPSKLSKTSIKLIEDNQNELFLSSASIWEIEIKHSIGKLEILDKNLSLKKFVNKSLKTLDIIELPIENKHIFKLEDIPYFHKDPFDRILIAQAISENLILITDDKYIKKYKIKTIW